MIDHVSLAVRDLHRSATFYDGLLGPLGLTRLVERPATIGFGKRYPELWINLRSATTPPPEDYGAHVCLRAPDTSAVDAFHAAALATGGACDGPPGVRAQYRPEYYAAFIRDPDGNRIEAVTFLPGYQRP